MISWTDDSVPDSAPKQGSPLRRLRAALGGRLAGLAPVMGMVRATLAIALVVCVLVAVAIYNRTEGEIAASVRAPSFAPTPPPRPEPVRLAPEDAAPGSAATGPAASPLLSLDPLLPGGQAFRAIRQPKPGDFCRDLAGFGFGKARWAESPVFPGEWECASPLVVEGRDAGLAFLVIRGRDKATLGSLMVKLNPRTPEEKAQLASLADAVQSGFAAASGLILPAEAGGVLGGWAPVEMAGIGGRLKLVAEHGRPDSRVLSLAVQPLLTRPRTACAIDCYRETRVLAGLVDPRKVKSVGR
ncbi:hypothetical protein GCM10011390_36850 [Aureimonas endophytica]|uniref:Uncharacterized protein n=1 Tax=Aureimonas endophytica TaxID=2027858 RepID=A0A916ZUD5_9HYPH|nr:DUF6030 family protein [Aureimonas endophytica]GGE14314.1 hypothetical protein GCM10011390_36850 [Aureimonas endophytica]